MRKFLLLVMVFIFVVGCVKEEEINLYINGGPVISRTHHFPVDTLGTYDTILTLQILADPIWNSITVKVNNEVLTDPTLENNSISFVQSISTDEIEYELDIESDLGDVYAICSMPGPFKIPEPPELVITPGQDCEVTWQQAGRAQWYEVDIVCFDTLHPPYHTWDTTVVCDDTMSVLVPGDKINYYGTMSVLIVAGNGASLLPGDEGNIKGDGKGYWIAKSMTHRAIKIGLWQD